MNDAEDLLAIYQGLSMSGVYDGWVCSKLMS